MFRQFSKFSRIQILGLLIVIMGIFLMASFLKNAKAQMKNNASAVSINFAIAGVDSGSSKAIVSPVAAIVGGE